ncbi:MAG: hypothetical protein WCZ87_00325 [Thiohalobacteraceae bacterium]
MATDLERNRDGFIVTIDGVWVSTSYVSALSGRMLDSDAVTEPVAGVPGVLARYTPTEYAQLTDEQREQVRAKAEAFVARWQPEPEDALAADDTQELDVVEDDE